MKFYKGDLVMTIYSKEVLVIEDVQPNGVCLVCPINRAEIQTISAYKKSELKLVHKRSGI